MSDPSGIPAGLELAIGAALGLLFIAVALYYDGRSRRRRP